MPHRAPSAPGRQPAGPFGLVRQARRGQELARIQPLRRLAAGGEMQGAERARQQFAAGQQFGLPRIRCARGAGRRSAGRVARGDHRRRSADRPSSLASARWRATRPAWMARQRASSACVSVIALSWSVVPDNAETTISTRRPRARWAAAMRAMLSQRARRHAAAAELDDHPGGVGRQRHGGGDVHRFGSGNGGSGRAFFDASQQKAIRSVRRGRHRSRWHRPPGRTRRSVDGRARAERRRAHGEGSGDATTVGEDEVDADLAAGGRRRDRLHQHEVTTARSELHFGAGRG